MRHPSSKRLAAATLAGAAALVAAAPVASAASGGSHAARTKHAKRHAKRHAAPPFTVIARGFSNPRHLSVGPDGALYVAEAGAGQAGGTSGPFVTDPSDPTARQYLGNTGSVTKLTLGRRPRATRVAAGLPSVAASSGFGAGGPASAVLSGGRLVVAMQDTNLSQDPSKHGANAFGQSGSLLGKLLSIPLHGGAPTTIADLAAFEAANNPDHGAGAVPGTGNDAIDSDPYDVVPYQGGFLVADAAGNDLLQVTPSGQIKVVAVFPLVSEFAAPGVAGPTGHPMPGQAVPTSVVVGPHGYVYVGLLAGFPFQPGTSLIYRIVPGQTPVYSPEAYARGLTSVTAMAVDHLGRLIVAEIDSNGAGDRGRPPTPGAILRINANGSRTVLSSKVPQATGVAVAPDQSIYASAYGTSPGSSKPSGEVVRLARH